MKLVIDGQYYRPQLRLQQVSLLQWIKECILNERQCTENEADTITQTVHMLMSIAKRSSQKGFMPNTIFIMKHQVGISFTHGLEKHFRILKVYNHSHVIYSINPILDSGHTPQPTAYARWKTKCSAEYMKTVPDVEQMLNYMTELLDTCSAFPGGIRVSNPNSKIGGDIDG